MSPRVPAQREPEPEPGGAWISTTQIYTELVEWREDVTRRLTALETLVRDQVAPAGASAFTRAGAALGWVAAAFAGGWTAYRGG